LAIVARNPGTNGIGGDGSLADIDCGILEDSAVNPVSEELVAAKSFTPSNGEGAIEGGGEDEFKGAFRSTDGEAGDIDLSGGVEGEVEEVDGLGDLSNTDRQWDPVVVVVGRNQDSSRALPPLIGIW